MKTTVGQVQRVLARLGVACLGLVPLVPLSAQEPKLRDTFKGHTNMVSSVAISPDGKTLFFAGDLNVIVAPVPASLTTATARAPRVQRARMGAQVVPEQMTLHTPPSR